VTIFVTDQGQQAAYVGIDRAKQDDSLLITPSPAKRNSSFLLFLGNGTILA
jgi:hypothetical protein